MDQESSLLLFYRNKMDCKQFQSQVIIGEKNFTRKRKLPFSFVDLCTSMICSARLAAWNIGEQRLAEEQLPEVVDKMWV